MTERIYFVIVLLALAGCASSNVEESKTHAPPTLPIGSTDIGRIKDDTISSDSEVPIEETDEHEAAVIADYIGLSVDEAFVLAAKQNRLPGVGVRDTKPVPITAIWASGRILFEVTDGIVTGADFPCGLEPDGLSR